MNLKRLRFVRYFVGLQKHLSMDETVYYMKNLLLKVVTETSYSDVKKLCGLFFSSELEFIFTCISIMWSPNRIVRFKGAFPDKKSTTWKRKNKKDFFIIFDPLFYVNKRWVGVEKHQFQLLTIIIIIIIVGLLLLPFFLVSNDYFSKTFLAKFASILRKDLVQLWCLNWSW